MKKQTRQQEALKIGDVYMICFDGRESEQTGWRPGVIFQNNMGNLYSPNVIALPMTTSLKKRGQPTHVVIPAQDSGLPQDSMVLCENPSCVSKGRLSRYITTLSDECMAEIAAASILASSAISFMDRETLLSLHDRAAILNEAVS
ncbi:MAG: type II toxin-antitoxin system PemK/MazF family toxin [Oscillospiraceae bacterium]|nr:type II toxin-antitoxin system PemK/MazF family toxin [Oscillospiraceae bacterium]